MTTEQQLDDQEQTKKRKSLVIKPKSSTVESIDTSKLDPNTARDLGDASTVLRKSDIIRPKPQLLI